jgi:hypothetical protein
VMLPKPVANEEEKKKPENLETNYIDEINV